MKPPIFFISLVLLASTVCYAEDGWKIIEDGFQFSIPQSWEKKKVQGTDSHVGEYRGKTAYLEFDEVFGLGLSPEETSRQIAELERKEADPKLLKPKEEIWRVDGRIAHFTVEKIKPTASNQMEFSNLATLHIPYPGEGAYLSVEVAYESDRDLPTVRKILGSITWKKKSPTSR